MPIVLGLDSYGGVTFDALDDSFSEKRLSPTVREIGCDVLLASAADWESLSALTTDISKERIPDGDFVIDSVGGYGTGLLALAARNTFTGYLTSATLSMVHANSGTHRAKCEWTTVA